MEYHLDSAGNTLATQESSLDTLKINLLRVEYFVDV